MKLTFGTSCVATVLSGGSAVTLSNCCGATDDGQGRGYSFDYNDYNVADPGGDYWRWGNMLSFSEWQSLGYDQSSRVF